MLQFRISVFYDGKRYLVVVKKNVAVFKCFFLQPYTRLCPNSVFRYFMMESGIKMRTYKIVLILLIALVLVAVAVVAALVFVDPSIYRNQLEKRASAAFGREFKIAGPIRLERSLRPRIIVEDISHRQPGLGHGYAFCHG